MLLILSAHSFPISTSHSRSLTRALLSSSISRNISPTSSVSLLLKKSSSVRVLFLFKASVKLCPAWLPNLW